MIQVLLVDDSAAVRGLLRKAIGEESDMAVCGVAVNGERAVQAYRDLNPDIVVMDIEMPVMDGVTALRQILRDDPGARIIMCSTLTVAGGDVTLTALETGAIDCLLKPSSESMFTAPEVFYRALLEKIRAGAKPPAPPPLSGASPAMGHVAVKRPSSAAWSLRLPPATFQKADVIAIGSSTGGVQALFTVLEGLGTQTPSAPIFITQHMPATFTKVLADHIRQKTGLHAAEAENDMPVEAGGVYIAPGGFHMEIMRAGSRLKIRLSDAPPENFCRPSVDPMLRSLIAADSGRMLVAILTGMGSDGLAGARMAVENGHMLIAQDEATSVVWGMPGAVAMAGLCHAVLPLDQIGPHMRQYL